MTQDRDITADTPEITVGRRELIQSGLLATLPAVLTGCATAVTKGETLSTAERSQRAGEPTVINLWPGSPPGGEHVTVQQTQTTASDDPRFRDVSVANVTTPTLTVFQPAKPNGASVLIIPGGGYRNVVIGKEGYDIARWLASEGITAFVLLYRLPADGWAAGPDAPLQDAQRAMRLIRHQASRWRVDPARVGIMGFSAGGHLAARLATRFDRATYTAADEADSLPARPDLAALAYPVISFKDGLGHLGSRIQALGPNLDPAKVVAYSAEVGVPASTPPTFLVHAADDGTVPVENSIAMFRALRQVNVPATLHVFESGGHGFALRSTQDPALVAWPGLFIAWCRKHRFLDGASALSGPTAGR
jgi:acetyl esterase/lipase